LDFFGPERLVLGTNYPYGPEEGCVLIKNSLAAINGLNLSKNDKEKVLGGNAADILGLGAA
jgi:predicted TIM-barrel fold metal-dependent hydrolase